MDEICQALEEMMDAADDAWEAERLCLSKAVHEIKQQRYDPAKEKFKLALDAYIDSRIERKLNKPTFDYIDRGVYDL